jgi:hypothetical protein
MAGDAKDPRSDAEKARADLVRNSELGLSVPESPIEQQPSVTPATFGETAKAAGRRSGVDRGLEAGGKVSEGDDEGPESLAEAEQRTVSRDRTAPPRPVREGEPDEDVLSRAKE